MYSYRYKIIAHPSSEENPKTTPPKLRKASRAKQQTSMSVFPPLQNHRSPLKGNPNTIGSKSREASRLTIT
jgi:hypothetical protein